MPVVRETHIVYTALPGDSLFSIATRFGSSVQEIIRTNIPDPHIADPNLIYPGWTILIPVPAERPYRTIYFVHPNDSLFRISQRFSTHLDLLAGVNDLQDPNLIFAGQPLWIPTFVYEVEQGDTLSSIARRFQIPLNQILYANDGRPGFSLDLLYVGFRLLLPLPTSRNIAVIRPLPQDTIRSGERVEGFARVFEANVLMQVRDDNDVIISEERFTTALEGPPRYGYFSGTVPFNRTPTTQGGELWVYSRSTEDGRIIDLVQVRVSF